MIQETITQIEERIKNTKSLNEEKKMELLGLFSTLKTEVSELSKTHAEHTQSITGFTEVSIHEAMREEKNPQLQLSLQALSAQSTLSHSIIQTFPENLPGIITLQLGHLLPVILFLGPQFRMILSLI